MYPADFLDDVIAFCAMFYTGGTACTVHGLSHQRMMVAKWPEDWMADVFNKVGRFEDDESRYQDNMNACADQAVARAQEAATPRRKRKRPRVCASCRHNDGEPDEATTYVEGRVPTGDRWMPYRGYLCDGHVEVMLDHGAEFPVQKPIGGNE